MSRRTIFASLTLLFVCGTAVCLFAARPLAKKTSVNVTCHFAYRTSTQVAKMKEQEIKVVIPVSDEGIDEIARIREPQKADFASVRVEVTHQTGSLIVRVYDKQTQRIIVSNLFQFGTDLSNQFHGGHGFTGLNYVYHPKDDSELQFWCSVNP
jgi:hypothetical protein